MPHAIGGTTRGPERGTGRVALTNGATPGGAVNPE